MRWRKVGRTNGKFTTGKSKWAARSIGPPIFYSEATLRESRWCCAVDSGGKNFHTLDHVGVARRSTRHGFQSSKCNWVNHRHSTCPCHIILVSRWGWTGDFYMIKTLVPRGFSATGESLPTVPLR